MSTDASRTQAPGEQDPATPRPMRVEMLLFLLLALFFLPVTIFYGVMSDWEPIGVTALGLLVGLNLLVGAYLWLVSRRIDFRAEDDPLGEVADHAGEIGTFSPHTWWPLVLGVAATLVFLGVAVAWWVTGLGFVLAIIGLVGNTFEFSRGIHKH